MLNLTSERARQRWFVGNRLLLHLATASSKQPGPLPEGEGAGAIPTGLVRVDAVEAHAKDSAIVDFEPVHRFFLVAPEL